ncbi:MAG: hypothetical protein IT285_09165 [Bdellovibrionales bacterium]|nr:hypothetical protein [Bdellovibrionales bacterium]
MLSGRIAETRPFLDDYLGSPLEVKLLRKAKVRAITYSNQIEGNALGESEVTAVLKGKRVAGSPRDIKEVQNYHAALDYVEALAEDKRALKLADMCDIQRLVTQGLIPKPQCGRVRTIPVSIVNAATGEKIEECPQPHALGDLLDDLWKWLEDTKDVNPHGTGGPTWTPESVWGWNKCFGLGTPDPAWDDNQPVWPPAVNVIGGCMTSHIYVMQRYRCN